MTWLENNRNNPNVFPLMDSTNSSNLALETAVLLPANDDGALRGLFEFERGLIVMNSIIFRSPMGCRTSEAIKKAITS
jgi:hypothetical protein